MISAPPVLRRAVETASALTTSDDTLTMQSALHRRHDISFSRNVFEPDNSALRDAIGGRDALFVCTPSVDRFYGEQIRAYISTLPEKAHLAVVRCTEANKSIPTVVEICEHATTAGLRRASPIVAVGGGVCSDIAGLAAALHHRGVPHINVPTTLLGLVDASVGAKNGVNVGKLKSGLGTFHPPELSLLDPAFLGTLPDRHIRNGLGEITKVATIADRQLFEVLAEHGAVLAESRFSLPDATIADQVIRRSVGALLHELSANLFEIEDYRRRMDFGHTFSPYIEGTSGYTILHGEAVAMDIALSTQIANSLGLITSDSADRILSLLQALGLALLWPPASVEGLWASLQTIVEHRNGDLNLVVPDGIGSGQFIGIESIGQTLIRDALGKLRDRSARYSRKGC